MIARVKGLMILTIFLVMLRVKNYNADENNGCKDVHDNDDDISDNDAIDNDSSSSNTTSKANDLNDDYK